MILLIRKRNAALIGLFFLCSFLLYSFHLVSNPSEAVSGKQNMQKVVMLDPGHGGEDPGAVSDFSGAREKDINLSIANRVQKLLEGDQYKVLLTRSEDRLEYTTTTKNIVQKRKEDLLRRKKLMDEAGANIVVSIHLNKFPQGQYFGAQTFFPPKSPESQRLALSLQKALRETADPNNKREALVKDTQPPIMILRDVKTTTAIVECGFLSNAEEEKKLVSEAYQDKIALAIKTGIDEYFKGK